MKKTLLAIALIASLSAGSALQADKKPAKPIAKPWYERATIVPTKPINNPKKLNEQIRKINAKIRKDTRSRDSLINDRTRAANKGDKKRVAELIDKIRAKNAKLAKHRALMGMYTMRLVALKSEEMKQEKAKEAKKKKKIEPKKKIKQERKEKTKKYE